VTSQRLHVTASIPDRGTALEDVEGGRAQVLVGVDAETAVRGGATETDNYRVRVLLVRERGHWLVSGLEQVG
jgi:hypothetical protein